MESRQIRRFFSLPELIFITLTAALNVVFDLFLSPILILLLGHIVSGILIMVPLNFLFISLTKHLVDKFGTLLLYMIVFSVIAVPTTFFGAVPGVYKIVVGVIVGILLDLAYTIKKPVALKIIIGGLVGAISWWMATFLIWTAFGYPFVTGMSNLLNNFIDMTWLISVPISHINGDFLLFIIFCGLLSSIQSIFFSAISYPIAQIIKKTAIYDRFTSFR